MDRKINKIKFNKTLIFKQLIKINKLIFKNNKHNNLNNLN